MHGRTGKAAYGFLRYIHRKPVFASHQWLVSMSIFSLAETEINTLRKTRSGALESTSDDFSSDSIFLGREDRDFEFSHLGSLKVSFAEVHAKTEASNDEADLKQVTEWLEEIAWLKVA